MILVVESGSTKADWMLVKDGKEAVFNTKGLNPFYHSKEDILIELNDHLELDVIKSDVRKIYFYGAGCSSPELNAIIEFGLQEFFTNAEIQVNHDLAACAYACYEGEPLISAILGTGSNSCYFDGENVTEVVPALSYILGDEGSGCHFGKRILADFLYNRLPDPISKELKQMGINKAVINESVYMKPDANVFIASFMPVLIRHKSLNYSQALIEKNFQEFIDVHIKCYADYKKVKVHFVGSVASLLQDELKAVCDKNDIRIGSIICRPLDKLVKYHLKKESFALSALETEDKRQLN
ncbi:MAG: ATPase [Crocinitomicaceae bacterium]|jgi:glucosamine kinase